MANLAAAGHACGVRRGEPLGEFLSAMIFCVGQVGEVVRLAQSDAAEAARAAEARSAAAQAAAMAGFQRVVAEQGKAASEHLQMAKHLSQAAGLAVTQAKNAQLASIVEKETLAARIVSDVMPTMVAMLQKVLVVREQGLNAAARLHHYLAAGLVAVALFGGGFGLRAYLGRGDGDAIAACLGHVVAAPNGHGYCDVAHLTGAAR